MEFIVNHFLMLSRSKRQNDIMIYRYKTPLIDEMFRDLTIELSQFNYSDWKTFHRIFKCIMRKNDLKKYHTTVKQYMITFTLDPKKLGSNIKNEDLLKTIELDIVDMFKSSQVYDNVIRISYVREGTDKDHKHPHWHFGIQTTDYFNKKWFLKYKFGFIQKTKSYKKNDFNDILDYYTVDKPKNVIYDIKM